MRDVDVGVQNYIHWEFCAFILNKLLRSSSVSAFCLEMHI